MPLRRAHAELQASAGASAAAGGTGSWPPGLGPQGQSSRRGAKGSAQEQARRRGRAWARQEAGRWAKLRAGLRPKPSPGQALGKATLAGLAAPAAGSKRRPLAAAFASQAHAPRRQSRHQEPAQAAAGEAPSSATAELCPLPEPAMASLPLLRCLCCSCWPAGWQRCRMQQGRSGGVGFQRLLCQGCKWLQAGGAQPLQATAQAGAAPASAGAAAAGCKRWQVAFIFPTSLLMCRYDVLCYMAST